MSSPAFRGMLHQVGLGLRLNARNRMAMIYGYVFPLVFLFAFLAIYRHDREPLLLHFGELLTVTALGGACFGLPTTLVSERERGVWRRYRVAPVSVWSLIAATLATRYVLLLSAALMQLAIALTIGMPAPAHPLDLLVAFTFTAFAFMGLGMVIAMLARNVPAVQALGQCIFLPMLMIGGVAVRLSSLPDWALHASAFFPGRYAVQAIQQSVTGNGAGGAVFELGALLLIGVSAGLATAGLFRWDNRPVRRGGRERLWLALAVGIWALVGIAAEVQGRAALARPPADEESTSLEDYLRTSPPAPPAVSETVEAEAAPAEAAPRQASLEVREAPARSWRDITAEDFGKIAYDRLPPDSGLVSPIAAPGEVPDDAVAAQLGDVQARLKNWPPARADDPVQRARNLLYVAAVPDVLQMEELERYLPLIVFDQLQREIPAGDLRKVLYWVAMHPDEGDDAAIAALPQVGLPSVTGPTRTARERVMLYAFKLLGRLNGDIRRTVPGSGARPATSASSDKP